MPVSSIGHLSAGRRWRRRLAPKDKGAQLSQEPAIIPLGDGARPAAQFGLDWLAYELFDNAPTHVDVAAVLDELALEHAFELRVAERFHQPLHPAELDDFRAQIQGRDAYRVRISGPVAQR